jgi:Domain of unknown function (DUF1905)
MRRYSFRSHGVRARVGISITSSVFTAVIKMRDVNPFILVSATGLTPSIPGWRKPLPVLVRINGEPADAWHINLMRVGDGSFYIYLHGDIRKASGSAVGDRARVELEFDASYRNGPQHPMPRWFKQALAANSQAMKNWTALIPSRKRRFFAISHGSTCRTRVPGIWLKPFTCFPAKPADSWLVRGKTEVGAPDGCRRHEQIGVFRTICR